MQTNSTYEKNVKTKQSNGPKTLSKPSQAKAKGKAWERTNKRLQDV